MEIAVAVLVVLVMLRIAPSSGAIAAPRATMNLQGPGDEAAASLDRR